MRGARGFSLIEAMSALAIAGVIIGGSTGAVMNINRLIADTSKRTAAWDESKRLEEFLIAKVQAAGGGAVRPHTSIFVSNAGDAAPPTGMGCRSVTGLPPCTPVATQGADRLTILTQVRDLPSCTITHNVGVNLVSTTGVSVCCLDEGLTPTAFENRQALLVGSNTTATVFLAARTSAGGDPCAINIPPGRAGQAEGMLPRDLAGVGYPATLVVVDTETYYVDRLTSDLNYWSDFDGDLVATANEITLVHDRVYDMQLAMGYDGLPEDGEIVDAASAGDEFLFNHPSDPDMPGASGTFAAVTTSQLRILQVAVAVGAPSQISGNNSIQLLDRGPGVSASGVYLTQTASKAFMRNLNLFTQ